MVARVPGHRFDCCSSFWGHVELSAWMMSRHAERLCLMLEGYLEAHKRSLLGHVQGKGNVIGGRHLARGIVLICGLPKVDS